MLRDSVVVRTRPRAIPLAMITIRKILHGFPFLSHDGYRGSAINLLAFYQECCSLTGYSTHYLFGDR